MKPKKGMKIKNKHTGNLSSIDRIEYHKSGYTIWTKCGIGYSDSNYRENLGKYNENPKLWKLLFGKRKPSGNAEEEFFRHWDIVE